MTIRQEVAGSWRRRSDVARLARNVSYEILPFRGTEQAVLAHVPTEVPLTVTVTEAKGIDATLDLAERLRPRGYNVAPHLPARQFVDRRHVADVVARLRAAEMRSVFVIGGDAPEPAGVFPDAFSLLQEMETVGHPFEEIGIGGYPEGHPGIPPEGLDLALKQKSPMATRVLTQICFDAGTTASWAARIAESGIELPVYAGIPGPVSTRKLMRISAGIGLGQSARFLRKQGNVLWRVLRPGGYDPTTMAKRLGTAVPKVNSRVRGLHIFTFNEVRETELWRRELVSSVSGKDDRE